MNHRLIAGLLFVLSLVGIFVGYAILRQPQLLGLCIDQAQCLERFITSGIGKPLYFGTRLLPVLFFALIFVPRNIFMVWAKFALFAAPLPLLLILISPATTPEMFTPERNIVTAPLVNLFVGLSFAFLLLQFALLHRKKKVEI